MLIYFKLQLNNDRYFAKFFNILEINGNQGSRVYFNRNIVTRELKLH